MRTASASSGEPSPRLIAHVDMDAFFVAVERLEDPSLRGKPVIVGGSVGQRGVVAAASYEARRFGVRSAMPMARARRLCPQAVYLPSNHEKYAAASKRVMEALGGFTPVVEVMSVDEAYLDLTGTGRLHGPPLAAAARIRQAVLEATGCSASIGAASNRMMSKVASELAKPAGILVVLPGREAALLAPLGVETLPGVGQVTAARLRGLGVRTVGELARLPLSFLEDHFKSAGGWLYRMARGEDETPLVTESAPKSIGRETTFAEDVGDPARLEAALSGLAEQAAARARRKGLWARGVTLKIRFADFTTHTRAAVLDPPSALDRDAAQAALGLLRKALGALSGGRKVRLVGAYLTGLEPAGLQPLLWEEAGREREERLTASVDAVRARFGFESLVTRGAIGGMDGQRKTR
ncbi:MAG: DNA polymerase IV [Nitrospinota bacterium]